MKLSISILVFVSIARQAKTLSLDCVKSDDGLSLTATFRAVGGGTINQIEGIHGTNGATDNCVSTLVTSGGSTAHELSITVLLSTGLQTVPTIGTSDCFVTAPTAPATTYTYNVVTKQSTAMIQLDDVLYTGSCDSTIDTSQAEVTGGVPVVNILTAQPAAVVTDTIAASLVDAAGVALATTDLGDTVKLRVTYDVPTGVDAGEFPVAIQIYDVVLSGYSDFRTTYNLYTSNGCINTTAQAALDTDAGITYNAGDSTAGDTHIFDTGLFTAAMFDGPAPKTMYVRFSYAATCLNVDDLKCADHEQYCTNNALTRKKRSASTMLTMDEQFDHNLRMKRNTPTTGKNGTLSFGVPINVHTEGATNALGGSDNREGSDVITDKKCKVPDMYWIIAVVLGVLLLCMMAMCVFLVLRLRREQNQNHHVAEKLGHQNSGYRY